MVPHQSLHTLEWPHVNGSTLIAPYCSERLHPDGSTIWVNAEDSRRESLTTLQLASYTQSM